MTIILEARGSPGAILEAPWHPSLMFAWYYIEFWFQNEEQPENWRTWKQLRTKTSAEQFPWGCLPRDGLGWWQDCRPRWQRPCLLDHRIPLILSVYFLKSASHLTWKCFPKCLKSNGNMLCPIRSPFPSDPKISIHVTWIASNTLHYNEPSSMSFIDSMVLLYLSLLLSIYLSFSLFVLRAVRSLLRQVFLQN